MSKDQVISFIFYQPQGCATSHIILHFLNPLFFPLKYSHQEVNYFLLFLFRSISSSWVTVLCAWSGAHCCLQK